jgi:hypothetical protein
MERKNQTFGTSMNHEMEQAMNQRTSKEPNTEANMNQTWKQQAEPNIWDLRKKRDPNTWNKQEPSNGTKEPNTWNKHEP